MKWIVLEAESGELMSDRGSWEVSLVR